MKARNPTTRTRQSKRHEHGDITNHATSPQHVTEHHVYSQDITSFHQHTGVTRTHLLACSDCRGGACFVLVKGRSTRLQQGGQCMVCSWSTRAKSARAPKYLSNRHTIANRDVNSTGLGAGCCAAGPKSWQWWISTAAHETSGFIAHLQFSQSSFGIKDTGPSGAGNQGEMARSLGGWFLPTRHAG